MSKLSLQIKNPCQENWYKMGIAGSGRHCASCQKIVTDFTQMTDAAIISYLSASTQNHCGRFKASQLERPLFREKTPVKRAPLKWSFLVAAWLSVSVASCRTDQVLPQKEMAAALPDKNNLTAETSTTGTNVISGFVKDKTDRSGLPGVTIGIKNTRFSTHTNVDGWFEILLPENYPVKEASLVISYIGYTSQQIPCSAIKPGPPSYYLEQDTMLMGEVIIVGKVQPKKGR